MLFYKQNANDTLKKNGTECHKIKQSDVCTIIVTDQRSDQDEVGLGHWSIDCHQGTCLVDVIKTKMFYQLQKVLIFKLMRDISLDSGE